MTPTAGAIPLSHTYYNQEERPIWLYGVGCTGRETSLLNCSHSLWETCSGDNRYAGVRCHGTGI